MSFMCIVCQSNEVTFDDIDSLEAHIASDHIRQFNYKCPQCPFERFCTETILHEHCIAVHQCDDYEVNCQHLYNEISFHCASYEAAVTTGCANMKRFYFIT